MIEHLLNYLLQRQYNDAQRRISLSDPTFNKIHDQTIVIKSTPTARRLAILQFAIFTFLVVYVFISQKLIIYEIVFSLLFFIGIFSLLKAFFSKVLVSPTGILSVSFFVNRHELRWCDVNGVGYFEPGNSLIISGLGQKIKIGVFSKGIYQAISIMKKKVNKEYWTQNALKWFDELEVEANLKKN